MPHLTLEMQLYYVPIYCLLVVTAVLVGKNSLKFSRSAFAGRWKAASWASAIFWALFAALMFPLAFFSIGAFGMAPVADGLIEILPDERFSLLRGMVAGTAGGLVAGAFSFGVTLALAWVAMTAIGAVRRFAVD
jgi:hypothetical protein